MTEERRKSWWIGCLVIGAFLLLAVLILIFGSLPLLFQTREMYTVVFVDAPGVAVGTPVRRSGVRVGEVAGVRLDEDGTVAVQLALKPTYRPRRSDKPTLFTGLIAGDSTIDFVPAEPEEGQPQPDWTQLEPGAQMEGLRGVNVNALLNRASEVVPTTQETMADIRKSILRLEKSAPLIDNALREVGDLGKTVRETLPDVRRTLDEVRELSKSIREAVPDVKVIGKDVARITQEVRDAVPEFRETNRQVQTLLKSINEVVPDAQKLVKSIEAAIPDARALMKGVNDAIPDARKTANEVTEFLRNVQAALPEIDKTNVQIREFVKSLNDSVPGARRTIEEGRELLKSVREAVPDVKLVIEDFGTTARRVTKVVEQIGNLIAENREKINTGIDRAITLIEDLSRTAERVRNILSEENQRNINETIRSIRDTANMGPGIGRKVDAAVVNFNASIDGIQALMKKVEPTLDSIRTTVGPLSESLQKVLNPMIERAPNLARNLDESLDKANLILKDVRTIIRVFGESDGTLNRFLTDPRLFNRVDEILFNVQKMTPRIEQIVKDFGIFADKLARHPESIGIGGVVRPSDGLKNPPPVSGLIIRP